MLKYDSTRALRRIASSVERTRDGITLRPNCQGAQALTLTATFLPAVARAHVSRFLYAHYHAHCAALLNDDQGDLFVRLGVREANPAFMASLRVANPGDGYFSSGWTIEASLTDGGLLVHRNGITLRADPDQHLSPTQRASGVRDLVSVRFPKDALRASPGYYVAYSNTGPARGDRLTRLYLNLRPGCVPGVMRELLHTLLRCDVPYTFKVLADPRGYRRRDNAVLYVRRTDYTAAAQAVCACHAVHPRAFGASRPTLPMPLRPGVGVADNPIGRSGDLSFGQHRSRLIADAIYTAAIENGAIGADAVFRTIVRRFEEEGMDPSRPYLNSADAEDYAQTM